MRLRSNSHSWFQGGKGSERPLNTNNKVQAGSAAILILHLWLASAGPLLRTIAIYIARHRTPGARYELCITHTLPAAFSLETDAPLPFTLQKFQEIERCTLGGVHYCTLLHQNNFSRTYFFYASSIDSSFHSWCNSYEYPTKDFTHRPPKCVVWVGSYLR